MRFWLLTNTTYGSWLPGDRRGSVTSVRDRRPGDPPTTSRLEHDRPGEPWEDHLPGIQRSAQKLLKAPEIRLNLRQAEVLLEQFLETARFRDWRLDAVSIMANHVHIVIGVPGDPDPKKVLADLKAYGTRALSRGFGQPGSGTWWTSRGSKRKLADERSIVAAINYVLYKQDFALVVWSRELGRIR
jgi:REP element-mobilizing transposase RayT